MWCQVPKNKKFRNLKRPRKKVLIPNRHKMMKKRKKFLAQHHIFLQVTQMVLLRNGTLKLAIAFSILKKLLRSKSV